MLNAYESLDLVHVMAYMIDIIAEACGKRIITFRSIVELGH